MRGRLDGLLGPVGARGVGLPTSREETTAIRACQNVSSFTSILIRELRVTRLITPLHAVCVGLIDVWIDSWSYRLAWWRRLFGEFIAIMSNSMRL